MTTIEYLRQYKVGEYALFDFAASFLGMLILAPLLSWLCKKAGIIVPKKNWVIFTLPLSIIAHVLVGKITPMTRDFLDPSGHYILKIVIVACLIFSFVGLKRA
ncbi:MAG: hypothetical protein WCK01_03430 [Candidatus Uhrbacteria bacterium]